MMKKAKWIWRYGDYEIFHNILLHMRRKRYGVFYPVLWGLDNVEPNVLFTKKFTVEKPTTFRAFANGIGHVRVNRRLFAIGEEISVDAGEYIIDVLVTNPRGLPAAFVTGDVIYTDETWICDDKQELPDCVGCTPVYSSETDDVEKFPFALRPLQVASSEKVEGGYLYDFGEETFAFLVLEGVASTSTVYFGESKVEALDTEFAYLRETVSPVPCLRLEKRAFRYVYVRAQTQPSRIFAEYEYLPIEKVGGFSSSDERLNEIYRVSEHTLELCAREFYIDGIKRDHWVWAGDDYQAFKMHNCLYANREIVKRSIVALLGKPPYRKHVNTINDYTFYLIISLYDYYFQTGDIEFVRRIWGRVKELYAFCVGRLDEDGFVCKRAGDWIFIDWSNTLDKEGPMCAEQILFWKVSKCMQELSAALSDTVDTLVDINALRERIFQRYYDEARGAFIDGYASGKRVINRQQNVLAVLFDFTDEQQTQRIVENVLCGDAPAITTPFFKTFELMALGKCGKTERVLEYVKSYWGGMLELGATSFWEEFDPTKTEHYSMYGDKYGKSLCHVWGGGPVCLLINYLAGISVTAVGGSAYTVQPYLHGIDAYSARMPVADGVVEVSVEKDAVSVTATMDGGTLLVEGKRYAIEKDEKLTVKFGA